MLKKIAALMLAILVLFSPDPPAANAAADYFSTPPHAQVERVVPSPYTVVSQSENEDMSTQQVEELESNLYASQQDLATLKKESPSFSGGLETSSMALERQAANKAAQEQIATDAAAVQENNAESVDGYRRENEAMAFGFVAASALGAILGTRFSAGKAGGYGKFYPQNQKDKKTSDSSVGGFSQHKPKNSPPPPPPPGVDEFLYNGRGLFDTFRSGVGGFGKDFNEKESVYFKEKSNEEVVSQTWVGGFSQYKPSKDIEYYQNKEIEASYELPSYEDGIDYDFKGINSFGLYRPDPSTIIFQEASDKNSQDVVSDDDDDVVIGGFSTIGGFGRYRPLISDYKDEDSKTTGDAGGFSQYKMEAEEQVKSNTGFENFSELTGYKIEYDQDDEDDSAKSKTRPGRIGGFSQYRPLEPPSSVYDSSSSNPGKFSFFGGAGSYSQYKRKAIEEVNTPAPATQEDVSISTEAILEDVEAIETMEAERHLNEDEDR